MARQRDVIEPRRFMSHPWYRKIGTGSYRFRFNPAGDGPASVTVHRAAAYRKWTLVHTIRFD